MTTMETERIPLQEFHDQIGDIIRAHGREPEDAEVEASVAKAVASGDLSVELDDDGNAYVEVPIRR